MSGGCLIKLYVLGDSISIHYGPYLEKFLQGVMEYSRKEGVEEALLNLDKPLGANGGDSSMVLAFLKARAATGGIQADVILLNCGMHDIKTNPKTGAKQVSIDNYRQNLRAIIDVVRQMGITLLWVRTAPFDEKIHNQSTGVDFHRYEADGVAYNQVADEVMSGARIPLIDLHSFTRALGPDLYCDHAHFHPSIREKQAAYLAGWLASWQARRDAATK